MNEPLSKTQSKVLILDDCDNSKQGIKSFCDNNNLIALTSREGDPLGVLKSYVDLSAIFISESFSPHKQQGLELAAEIHFVRPELPIFFRCEKDTIEQFKNVFQNRGICCAYHIDNIDELKSALDENIFNREYPNALLRGIEEIAHSCLLGFFDDIEIEYTAPYLVKDRIIYGELFSLVSIESDWCKGCMMLQTTEDKLLDLVPPEKINSLDAENFRAVNDVLSEVTNLIWGGIKNRFLSMENTRKINNTQVPIIINHKNQYITFGTDCPLLCFHYTLRSKVDSDLEVTLYHKFIFNVNWAPEQFKDSSADIDAFLESGELEFF